MASGPLAKTREATLALLLKQGQASAGNLALVLGISVQAMRRHLRSLESDGFVEASSTSQGPGRPSNSWQLTAHGFNLFNDSNGSERFAIDLLDSMKSTLTEKNMVDILYSKMNHKVAYYRKKIGSGALKNRLKKLIELRKEEGYLSDLHLSNDGMSWYLDAFHCSIKSIAEEYPVVCDYELELIQNIFPDCQVKRVQWRLESGHSCGFEINIVK